MKSTVFLGLRLRRILFVVEVVVALGCSTLKTAFVNKLFLKKTHKALGHRHEHFFFPSLLCWFFLAVNGLCRKALYSLLFAMLPFTHSYNIIINKIFVRTPHFRFFLPALAE